jgi:hypothetical protein
VRASGRPIVVGGGATSGSIAGTLARLQSQASGCPIARSNRVVAGHHGRRVAANVCASARQRSRRRTTVRNTTTLRLVG